MKIDLTKLHTLKELVRTTKDLSKPMYYFFDHFADHKEFSAMSYLVKDKDLERFIIGIGQKIFKKQKITIQRKQFLSVKGYNFIHGPIIIENRMMSIAYFPDIRLGIFSLVLPPQTLFGRITAIPVHNFPSDPSLN